MIRLKEWNFSQPPELIGVVYLKDTSTGICYSTTLVSIPIEEGLPVKLQYIMTVGLQYIALFTQGLYSGLECTTYLAILK